MSPQNRSEKIFRMTKVQRKVLVQKCLSYVRHTRTYQMHGPVQGALLHQRNSDLAHGTIGLLRLGMMVAMRKL